jgi:hypothetical protein
MSLVPVKMCKTVAEYEGQDTRLYSSISISRIKNVSTINRSERVKETSKLKSECTKLQMQMKIIKNWLIVSISESLRMNLIGVQLSVF